MADGPPDPYKPPQSRVMRAINHSAVPAVIATFMVGCCFTALKFVLIGRIAFDWDPHAPHALDVLPWDWLKDVVLAADHKKTLDEAMSQAMGVVLTLGLLFGFPVNGPLAGAWRCDRLFVISTIAVGFGSLMALWFNAWGWALFIGVAYGAACAARGKIVPLLASATATSNTKISGAINAALAIGLLAGTLVGSFISQEVSVERFAGRAAPYQHLLLLLLAAIGVGACMLVRVPEPPMVPFAAGLRDFTRATSELLRRHWALLAGGGLAWGITAAASLAMYVHAVDTLHLPRGKASTLAGFAAIGAIVGNLVSHWGTRRRYVVAAFLGLSVVILAYPHLVVGFWSAAVAVFCIGLLFAAPANVLDARFLANAHAEGHAGLGGTAMSFVHSVFIFLIGVGLAIPLFLGLMPARAQFPVLAGVAAAACAVAAFARINRDCTGRPVAA